MKILVDTCIWSQVLRKKTPNLNITKQLKDFIYDGRVVMIGPIRQELLSGISNPSQFNKLKHTLSFFEDIILKTDHFVKAAEFNNLCRKNGIQGSTTDFLICAVANLEKLSIFTVDSDFINYNKYLKIKLIK
ncbi:MAG: PIN domain-containing protein [Candidatus Scalindua sp.]|nr:PIN domain-containing protein [Candidatus Scalindua sp.]